jgi:hypothetical protein
MNKETVLVATGTCVENIDIKGKAITVISEQGADVMIIDGNWSESAVTCETGEGAYSVMKGFAIITGDSSNGGGMYNESIAPTTKRLERRLARADDTSCRVRRSASFPKEIPEGTHG